MAKELYWPIANQKYPWLTDEEVTKLENYVSWLWYTGYGKVSACMEYYNKYINAKKQKEQQDNAVSAINQLNYMSNSTNDKKQANSYSNNANLEKLVSDVKALYNIDKKTDSSTVLSKIIQEAKYKGVSASLLNDYLQNGNKDFYYEMWYAQRPMIQSEEKSNSTLKNIWWGLLDSFMGDFARLWAKGTAWTMKKLWMDEEKVDAKLNNALNTIDSTFDVGQNKNSTEYELANMGWDVAQMLVGEWELKLLAKVPSVAKVLKWVKNVDDFVKKVPAIWKLTSWLSKTAARGAADTVAYNAVNAESTSLEDMEVWAALNAGIDSVLPTAKMWKKLASRLEIWWLIDSPALTSINNYIKNAGWEAMANVKAAGNWLLERGMWGDRESLRWTLNEWRSMWGQAKNEILDQAKTEVESESARTAINELLKKYKGQWALGEKYAQWLEMIKDKTTFTARELDNIIWLIDDSWLHIYNKWETADKISAKLWSDIRRDLKEQVEKIAKDEWLGDIRAINSEIQISRAFEEWIYGKEIKEEASNLASAWWPVAQWYSTAMSNVTSTKNATTVANLLAKLSWMEKKDIANLLWKKGKFSEDLLNKIFKWDTKKVKQFIEEYQWVIDNALPDKRLSTWSSWKSSKSWKDKLESIIPDDDISLRDEIRKALLVWTYESWK